MRSLTILHLLLSLPLLSACYSAPQSTVDTVTLSAIEAFRFEEGSGIYAEKSRQGLAINAAKTENREIFIPSTSTVNWLSKPQDYQAIITVTSEIDGESRYQLLIGDKLIKEVVAPETDKDFFNTTISLGSVILKPQDTLTIQSNAVTNGKIPENGGTAYSRGRWTTLDLIPE